MLNCLINFKDSPLIPFIVAGHPDLEKCEAVIDALVAEGVTTLELGVPFSDALADGPVIQSASEKISMEMSLADVLLFSRRTRERHPGLSLILFTYLNPILAFGIERFALETRASGIAAVLVVDLPPEEAREYREAMGSHPKTIFLASPTTTPERLKLISEASNGFIYYVSRTGVTGMQSELSETLSRELGEIRKQTSLPIAVGFGISSGGQAERVMELADAVVVGSAIVAICAREELSHGELTLEVGLLARDLMKGARAGSRRRRL